MQQKSRDKVKRWFAWIGGCAIVLALTAGGFWYWTNIPPQVNVPTPVMLHPNGYDYFVRAAAAYVLDNKGVDEITDTEFVKDKQYPLAAKEAWLQKNAKAFQLLREGLKYPALQPPVRSYNDKHYTNYSQFRNMTRGWVVESHARAERGDWNGAVQSLLDDYHFGNQIGRGGSLIGVLVSVATQAISLKSLAKIVERTDTTTAKMAATNIERIYEQREPLSEYLQEYKWETLSQMLELMKSPSQQLHSRFWRIGMIRNFGVPIVDYPKIFTTSKRKFIFDLAKAIDELIENAQRPYVKQLPDPTYSNPLMKEWLPSSKLTRWNWARGDTASVAIMTMYALHAYKLDNGHYPKNLKALVPMYLHKIPIDPFDGIAPMQYELQGEKYVLWSVGPDGVDNHGTPITNKNQKRAPYINWSDDSKGDVVAGKNTP